MGYSALASKQRPCGPRSDRYYSMATLTMAACSGTSLERGARTANLCPMDIGMLQSTAHVSHWSNDRASCVCASTDSRRQRARKKVLKAPPSDLQRQLSEQTEESMTESLTAEVLQLVQEGRAAALAGDTIAARTSFRRATELDPTYADAWLGLSGVVPILAEKRTYLQRALALTPDNAEAATSLRYVEKLLADGQRIAPSLRREEHHITNDATALPTVSEPTTTTVEYCYRHPQRETGLHCIQCNRAICGPCAQTTPVGQLCPECRRGRRPSNYQVSISAIVIGGIVAVVAAALVAIPVALFGSGLFGLLIIFMVGPAIAEFVIRIVDRFTRLKRGRPMQISVGIAMAIGTLLVFLVLRNPLLLAYLIVAVSTAVARLR